jgi:radical SAM superfamily enzyme YgiQ (UPF0313 family)/glycosyltransferase involved in cell wall biosynthesis
MGIEMEFLPKVTVVVPSYNHERFLARRLESIFTQTYKNIELLVIDDCSSDDSDSVIRSFLQKHSFRYIRNGRNSGSPFAAWETAASLATGRYIWICESDDYADPAFLETAVSMMEKRPKAVLFYCDSVIIDGEGMKNGHTDNYFHDIWKQSRWDNDFISDGPAELAAFQVSGQTVPNMSSALIVTEAFRKAYNPFLKKLKLAGDWLFIGRLMRHGEVIYCKKTLNYFRSHENTSRAQVASARSQAEYIMTKYLLFCETKQPVRNLARVVKNDAVRFIYEPASAWEVLKAFFRISITKTMVLFFLLAISVLLNIDLLKKFFHRYKAVQKINLQPQSAKGSTADSVQSLNSDTCESASLDILLLQAPGWGVSTPPLATAMLTAYARQKGYKVLPVDLNSQFFLHRGEKYTSTWELAQSLYFWNTPSRVDAMLKDNEEIVDGFLRLIAARTPKAVGFTIYESSVYVSLYLARKIKAISPEIKIIFGGPHASRFMHGKSPAAEDCVDVVAQGEGEWILGEFLRRLKGGDDIYSIPGTLVKKDGVVIDNGDAELLRNLNDLPYADFSDFDFKNYLEPFKLPIMSSRGCVNRCIFCNERPYWRIYRSLTAARLFDEVKSQLGKYPFIDWIDFQDSVVNGNVKELERFAELILESGMKLRWSGQAVIRKEMTPELLKKLKKSGCICLAYGLETPSTSLMLKVGKAVSRDVDIDKLVKDCADAGLTCAYNFMFGLPGETEDDANLTLEFLERNKPYFATVNPSPCFCAFSPGTLGYEKPQEYGLDFTKGHLYWETNNGANNYLVRLERFENFCKLVHKLGVPTTYPYPGLLEREKMIGEYHFALKEYDKAAVSFKEWLEKNPQDKENENKYSNCLLALNKTEL